MEDVGDDGAGGLAGSTPSARPNGQSPARGDVESDLLVVELDQADRPQTGRALLAGERAVDAVVVVEGLSHEDPRVVGPGDLTSHHGSRQGRRTVLAGHLVATRGGEANVWRSACRNCRRRVQMDDARVVRLDRGRRSPELQAGLAVDVAGDGRELRTGRTADRSTARRGLVGSHAWTVARRRCRFT